MHVVDSNVLFSAAGDIPFTAGNAPISGGGRRMMWYAYKAAFRAGYVDGAQWDKDSTGAYSIASGYKTKAIGFSAVSLGNKSVASGDNAVALGADNIASGIQTFATGNFTTAYGHYSTSMGYRTTASGTFSTSMGRLTEASGEASTAIGNTTLARANSSLAIGLLNDTSDINTISSFLSSTDRIFQIGNGTPFSDRKNAMTVLRNGNVGIGILDPNATLEIDRGTGGSGTAAFRGTAHASHFNYSTDEYTYIRAGKDNGVVVLNDIPGGKVGIGTSAPGEKLDVAGNIRCVSLTQTSDSRLKKDISPLQNSLQKIIQLNGYNYFWKSDVLDNSLQTGILAQEVKKIFPELVKEDKDGMLSVNYSGLIPVLIESIKEQQKEIEELKRLLKK